MPWNKYATGLLWFQALSPGFDHGPALEQVQEKCRGSRHSISNLCDSPCCSGRLLANGTSKKARTATDVSQRLPPAWLDTRSLGYRLPVTDVPTITVPSTRHCFARTETAVALNIVISRFSHIRRADPTALSDPGLSLTRTKSGGHISAIATALSSVLA